MHRFSILDGIEIAMRDGTILRGDVWLPEGCGPWPVLLQRTPYRREDVHGAQYISALEFQQALRRGMAVMVQDTRGRYGSDGAFEPFLHEGPDGADTIAWLLAQPFCNGQVAMFGASYVGATQVLAAAENPEGLVAISPQLTTARHGDTWLYRGGAIELGFILLWIIEALGAPDLDRRLAAMDAGKAGLLTVLMARLQQNPEAAFADLAAIADTLCELAPYAARWLDRTRAALSQQDREHLPRLAESRVAMLVTGGWNDLFIEGSIELFRAARARGNGAEGRDRLIIGPWSHGNPKDWQGDMWHGYHASTAGLSDAQLDFFADIFGGRAPRSPTVRYFRTGSNTWHEAPDWPLPGRREAVLHLDGAHLTAAPPSSDSRREWTSDPADPVPTTGGATFLPGLLLGRNSGPVNQARIEARPDVICFTGELLDHGMEVTGCITLHLRVTSSAETCDWTARLCEVLPDGRSLGLVDGIQRWERGTGQVPEEPVNVVIKLGHISHWFAKGSRLRLQVASSNFPQFDVNRQTKRSETPQTAQLALWTGPGGGGRLVLPIIETPFPEATGIGMQGREAPEHGTAVK